MIKVLHVVSSLKKGGGVQHLLLNYFTHFKKSEIHFDYVVHGKDVGELEGVVKKLNSNVYHVTPKKVSVYKNLKEINTVIKNGNYDIVHCHQDYSNLLPLFLAFIHSVPVRISHAHSNFKSNIKLKKMKNYINRKLTYLFANKFFSCSLEAGKWLHGENWYPGENNILMKNAINIHAFSYNKKVREKYRKQLNVENMKVLLHVGRISSEKNHEFMLEILENILLVDKKFILIFVGDGDKEEEIKISVRKRGLNNSVKFLGPRSDIPEIMNASDVFLLPSKNEGFGITAVEAQVAGLNTLVSNNVPIETKFTKMIKYLPLDSAEIWKDVILNLNLNYRESNIKAAENDGFSILNQAYNYENWIYNNVSRE